MRGWPLQGRFLAHQIVIQVVLCQPVCPKYWHVMAHMKGRRIKLTSKIVGIQI